MGIGFYPHLAWDGIRKNKRLYLPYILTCTGMVMMFYIIAFLAGDTMLKTVRGGSFVTEMLGLGTYVIMIFAVIFLFYTNSFLMKRRKKEFGLYNVLGMGKGNLARILFWESVQIAFISISTGLVFGMAFAKLGEIAVMHAINRENNYNIKVNAEALLMTLKVFGAIYVLLFFNMVRQIKMSNTVELLKSDNKGEKPPKANWFIALCGVVILGGAYYIAVTIGDPITTLSMFFVAVIMVIIGTYLLFIAGSVTLCRILQKNKHYYYKTNHFVSVSSMLYRMKRNGAGLASICILCTMVLVMLSSTVCLYTGEEGVIRNRYPKDIDITVTFDDYESMDGYMEKMKTFVADGVSRAGGEAENVVDYSAAIFGAVLDDGRIVCGEDEYYNFNLGQSAQTYKVFVISADDYNRLMNDNLEIADDEAVICFTKGMGSSKTNSFEELSVGDGGPCYKVKKVVDKFISNGTEALNVLPAIYIFVNNPGDIALQMMPVKNSQGSSIVSIQWFYQFDMTGDEAKKLAATNEINAALEQAYKSDSGFTEGMSNILIEGRAAERDNFYTMFGALLFLAIFLGIVFVLATVLIIYYKQVTEGYEDCGRFEIMKKLGMTRRDIKSSINSQMLTVFFLPIVAACVHLAFAFPIVSKLLMCFGFNDKGIFALVNVVCVLVFALFYVIVYRITSKSYYNIVNE